MSFANMHLSDILSESPVPEMNYQTFMNKMMASYDKYPKNSLSPREVVNSISLGDIGFEEAQKIADNLNSEVTKTILDFQVAIGKKLKAK